MIYSTWIKKLQSVALLISSVVTIVQSDVPRPRGVSLSKASLYSPTKDFTCFDGTVTIPFTYVNDDYCDCFDGSDEPGTSACLNSVFHCTNAGHKAQNIPSSRVNDGICDCCDGTDEYATPGVCANSCEELGREARAEAQRLAELHKAGSHLRAQLIESGNQKRSEMAEKLSQLEKDKAEAEKIKAEKEAIKSELENKENEALKVYREADEQEKQKKAEQERAAELKGAHEQFDMYDLDSDGILTLEDIKLVKAFDSNKDEKVDEEDIRYFFGDNESVDKDAFVTTTWPLLKPLLMAEQGLFKPAEDEEADPDAEESSDLDNEDLGADDENLDADSPADNLGEQELEQEHTRNYDDETQKLVDEASEARRHYTDAERNVREIESNIRSIKENLEKDYGLHQEFATLDGQCLEYEDKEYIYKLCLFQKVTQKSKNGGWENSLGTWGEWVGVDDKYSIMKYVNGVGCWNGPNRITNVHIQCGLETKLLSVTEPYRCEYKIELSTPAACDDSTSSQQSHDEL